MRLEEIVDDLRARRARLSELRDADDAEADFAAIRVDEAIYDSRLIKLATMLDVPLPLARPQDGGLYANDRYLLEDRIAEAGVDLRRPEA